MPNIRPELFFINILVSLDKIKRNVKNISYIDFVTDEKIFALVTREMQEIGESAKKIKRNPGLWNNTEIDWQDIISFRNIVVHRYFGINPEIIFEVAISEVPQLEKSILKLVCQSKEKTYILKAIWGMREVFNKINRKETIYYLDQIASLIKD